MDKVINLLYAIHMENMGILNILCSFFKKEQADEFRKSMKETEDIINKLLDINNEVDDGK